MKRREFLLAPAAFEYKRALPGYRYEFPRDHFEHPDYKTEWWYYTGNVRTAEGRPFGYELTFFRQAIDRVKEKKSAWQVDEVYLAHFALSDIEANRFHHFERLNRAGPGIAGASFDQLRIWNGNWQVRWSGNRQTLEAITEEVRVSMTLDPAKPPVIHGRNGVSQKSEGVGKASLYVSQTRLATTGTITLQGKPYVVTGSSWMDHEIFTHSLESNQAGWDWFSLQLDNGCELMLYRLRRKDGSIEPYSSGTFVEPTGKSRHLTLADFLMTPSRPWKSPATGANYPLQWTLQVPSLNLQLRTTAVMDAQELVSRSRFSPTYWEGAILIAGSATGVGYLEMTGYDRAVAI